MTAPSVTVEIPEELLSDVRQVRMLVAAQLYGADKISSSQAAELANVSRVEFLLSLSRYRVFPLAAELEELEQNRAL